MEGLELKRLHCDLILAYKILYGLTNYFQIFSYFQTLSTTQEAMLKKYLTVVQMFDNISLRSVL